MSDDIKRWSEAFDETYYSLSDLERPYFLRHCFRIMRDRLRASIKDQTTGAGKEKLLRRIQNLDAQIAEIERTVPPPGGASQWPTDHPEAEKSH